jgi:hypothetical protein
MGKVVIILLLFGLGLFYAPSFTEKSFHVTQVFQKDYYTHRYHEIIVPKYDRDDVYSLIWEEVMSREGYEASTEEDIIINIVTYIDRFESKFMSGTVQSTSDSQKLIWAAVKREDEWELVHADVENYTCDSIAVYKYAEDLTKCEKIDPSADEEE